MYDRIAETEKIFMEDGVSRLERKLRSGVDKIESKDIDDLKLFVSNKDKCSLLRTDGSGVLGEKKDYMRRYAIADVAGELVTCPGWDVFTDEYWTSNKYSSTPSGTNWRPVDKIDDEFRRREASGVARNYLEKVWECTEILGMDPKKLVRGIDADGSDGSYRYIGRTVEITDNLLELVDAFDLLLAQESPNDEVVNNLSDRLKKLPDGVLTKVWRNLYSKNVKVDKKSFKFPVNEDESFWEGELQERGKEYYRKHLSDVMPGLVELIRQESGEVKDEERVVMFLDRDARAILHAYRVFEPKISATPVVANSVQFQDAVERYQRFSIDLVEEGVTDPDEWSARVDEEYDKLSLGVLEYWREVFGKVYEKKLGSKKEIILVDIGYNGGLLETVRYIISKAFPEANVKSVLMYKISRQAVRHVAEGSTWFAEFGLPKTVDGLLVGEGGVGMKYLRQHPEPEKEREFYAGIIEEARAHKKSLDSL